MIYAKGDYVRYHGGVLVERAAVLMAGDEAFVTQPNEDPEEDVLVVFQDVTFAVSPEDLEWVHGG